MGSTVLANRNPRMGRTDVNVEMGIADGIPDLLERAPGGKHRKGRAEYFLTRSRNACGDANHVALGNSAVEEAIRIRSFEPARLGCCREVGIQDHKVVALGAQRHKLLTVADASGDSLLLSH